MPVQTATLVTADPASLHALYADCLGGDGVVPSSGLSTAFERDFGSVDGALAEFSVAVKALADGPGWALLCWSSPQGRLLIHRAGELAWMPAGATAVLALDAEAASCVDEVMRRIDWSKVYRRYGAAVAADAATCMVRAADASESSGAQLLDVRRPEHLAHAKDTIAGAAWRDPGSVDQWVATIDRSRPVLVACVHGLDVGRSTALALRARGVDARCLAGGIEGWREAGLPMQPRGEES